jgi:hypothetical protein
MKMVLLVCAILAAYVGIVGYFRKQALMRRESFLQHVRATDKTVLEYLGYIPYHGGLPEVPKPQKLHIAVSTDYLLLFSNTLHFGKIPFGRWHDIETFTTKLRHDAKKQSLVLWGPLSHLLRRDIVRHFIVIHYTDVEDQENHLLLEHPNQGRLKELYERLSSAYENSQLNN